MGECVAACAESADSLIERNDSEPAASASDKNPAASYSVRHFLNDRATRHTAEMNSFPFLMFCFDSLRFRLHLMMPDSRW